MVEKRFQKYQGTSLGRQFWRRMMILNDSDYGWVSNSVLREISYQYIKKTDTYACIYSTDQHQCIEFKVEAPGFNDSEIQSFSGLQVERHSKRIPN